jgi:hypothetical protein
MHIIYEIGSSAESTRHFADSTGRFDDHVRQQTSWFFKSHRLTGEQYGNNPGGGNHPKWSQTILNWSCSNVCRDFRNVVKSGGQTFLPILQRKSTALSSSFRRVPDRTHARKKSKAAKKAMKQYAESPVITHHFEGESLQKSLHSASFEDFRSA